MPTHHEDHRLGHFDHRSQRRQYPYHIERYTIRRHVGDAFHRRGNERRRRRLTPPMLEDGIAHPIRISPAAAIVIFDTDDVTMMIGRLPSIRRDLRLPHLLRHHRRRRMRMSRRPTFEEIRTHAVSMDVESVLVHVRSATLEFSGYDGYYWMQGRP